MSGVRARDEGRLLSFDIGTTGAKTCLYRVRAGGMELVASSTGEYPLSFLANGGVEQDPERWWTALGEGTRRVLHTAGMEADSIGAISFCCQMQGLVLVDEAGRALRPAMSYMDQRGTVQRQRLMERGLRIGGMDAARLIPSLIIAGGVSASVKDPVWKYHWVRDNEPEVFARVAKWLDAKEYLAGRCTGRFAMTPDSANATFLYDTRPERVGSNGLGSWNARLCSLFEVDPRHLPEVVAPAEVMGSLLPGAAADLGLVAGIPVIGGGGDLSLVALGSGALLPGQTHVYMGTSGWVSAVTDRRVVDTESFIASVIGAVPGRYNYISEHETSGKCMEWVRDHLVLDEIGAYLGARTAAEDPDARYGSLYELLDEAIDAGAPGSAGVMFTPWLHGNRSPFENPDARGIFFNIGVDTGKRCLVRAVAEGIALHNRWQLEAMRRKVPARGPLRFVGGGARSRAIARILADATGEVVETVESPQNVGALGAAILSASALGWIDSLDDASDFVPPAAAYEPDPRSTAIYDERLEVFKSLYTRNKGLFSRLNARPEQQCQSGFRARRKKCMTEATRLSGSSSAEAPTKVFSRPR
ncbi:MAG TPA: FGGY-family carbohydrate kinase [Rectinemataceae bacterium]|nr:FGGY-family carbohydrate kinase [Rectinemataceae bacterium]